VPDTSSRINDLQGLKSSINIQYIDKKSKEAKKLWSLTYRREVMLGHDLETHQHV
jgi:hypothetical protein